MLGQKRARGDELLSILRGNLLGNLECVGYLVRDLFMYYLFGWVHATGGI